MSGRWNDDDLISGEILAFLRSADHVVANVEGPVIGARENTENSGAAQLLHSIDPDAVKVLKNIGADIWNINNNHIMDAGPEGLASTIGFAKSSGAAVIGAGMDIQEAKRPVILPEAGGIGIFGVGYRRACRAAGEDTPGCFPWSDDEGIREVIAEIKKNCRWCVVVSHGGEEFTALPSPYVRDRYLMYLDMGADVVVSHHPHVPMNYETVGNKVIFYSLGNFIFDTDYQRSQNNTEKGLLVKLDFTENNFTWEAKGLRIVRGEEKIVASELPLIFRDVPEKEYELLAPLAAKLLVQATKRQMTFLYPDRFKGFTEAQWAEHFAEPLRTGRVPGEVLDFYIVCPLAEKEKEKAWQNSRLE
ncbi:MAG: CapA family protein, partial [Clostridia bacterium]|nr:CapA family protein [Clostridia bacterium]